MFLAVNTSCRTYTLVYDPSHQSRSNYISLSIIALKPKVKHMPLSIIALKPKV
jgi:hypothetical protein